MSRRGPSDDVLDEVPDEETEAPDEVDEVPDEENEVPDLETEAPDEENEAPHADAEAPIALVLIDDNRLLREGIVAMVRTQPDFRVLAASADVEEALAEVRKAKPDVVLLDLGLDDHDSLSLTSTVRSEVPSAQVIIMGLLSSSEDIADFVRAGAAGFIMKDATFEEFFRTIRAVARGAFSLPLELTDSLLSQIARNAVGGNRTLAMESVRLTVRERQVVEFLSEGLSNKAIAARMHIAVHTVKSHVHNVLEKLALRSRLEVAAFTHRSRRKDDNDD